MRVAPTFQIDDIRRQVTTSAVSIGAHPPGVSHGHREVPMRRLLLSFALILGLLGATAPSALAITGGQPDGVGHPYGALLLVPGITFCSGTLIQSDVILTAGHCTDFWTN